MWNTLALNFDITENMSQIWHKWSTELGDIEIMPDQAEEIHLLFDYQPLLCAGYMRSNGCRYNVDGIALIIASQIGDPLGELIQCEEHIFYREKYWQKEISLKGYCMAWCITRRVPQKFRCQDCHQYLKHIKKKYLKQRKKIKNKAKIYS